MGAGVGGRMFEDNRVLGSNHHILPGGAQGGGEGGFLLRDGALIRRSIGWWFQGQINRNICFNFRSGGF